MEPTINTASANEHCKLAFFHIQSSKSHNRVLSRDMFGRHTISKQAMPRQAKHHAIGTKKGKNSNLLPVRSCPYFDLCTQVWSVFFCIKL